jgi:4-hydroxy-tetrahydrodipicolinate synthase
MTAFAFPGLNLALATPFDEAGRIDLDRLEQNIERYLAAGIQGFVLSSGTGMHVYLSSEEAGQVIERGAKVINGRARIIAQTSALMAEDVVARTRRAADAGADGVMVLPPFFEGPTDDEGIVDFYAEVAGAGLPVIGYNVPHAVGVEITPGLYRKLAQIPGFASVKDSSGDLGAQASLIRTGLPVMNGADTLAPYALYAGAAGLIWGGANIAPRACLAVVRAAAEGRWSDARAAWARLEPIMSLIWAGDYVQAVYAAADLTGHGAGSPRKPLRALPGDRIAAIREALGDLIQSERAL